MRPTLVPIIEKRDEALPRSRSGSIRGIDDRPQPHAPIHLIDRAFLRYLRSLFHTPSIDHKDGTHHFLVSIRAAFLYLRTPRDHLALRTRP